MKMSVLAYTYDKTQKTRNLIIQLLTIRPQREAQFINPTPSDPRKHGHDLPPDPPLGSELHQILIQRPAQLALPVIRHPPIRENLGTISPQTPL